MGCLKKHKIQSLASKTINSSAGETKEIHRKSLENMGAGISPKFREQGCPGHSRVEVSEENPCFLLEVCSVSVTFPDALGCCFGSPGTDSTTAYRTGSPLPAALESPVC